jgi:acyl-CoA dehydrogenase
MGAFMSDLDDLLGQILGRAYEHAGEDTDGALWPVLAEAGLTRVGIADDLGGSGGEQADAAAVVTRAAEAGLALPLAEALFPVACLARAAGTPVPPGIVTVAVLGAGSWTAAPGGYRIQASGVTAAWGAQADELWALAPANSAQAGLARLHPGSWDARPGRNLAGEPRDEIGIDTIVPNARALLLPASVLRDTRVMGALARSCQLLGALRACVRLCHEYVLLRHQFGQPLSAHQVVRHAIAGLVEEAAAAEAAVAHAVGLLPEGSAGQDNAGQDRVSDPATVLAIAAAKAVTSRSAGRAARVAHQLHGAVGLTAEHPLHYYTTRLWAWQDEYGPASYWNGQIAGIVRDTYHGDLWTALTAQGQATTDHA